MRIRWAASVVFLWLATTAALSQNVQIGQLPPQGAVAGQNYTLPLSATGGAAPYSWHLVSGDLPPGLKLHPHNGKIAGIPTTPGDYNFTIKVSDANIPHAQASQSFAIHVIAGLVVDWKEAPKVSGNVLSGSAVVVNDSGHKLDVTVIIVAVNEIGRATALGYQRFTLASAATSPVIPFGSSPGLGTYYVRADVVAHSPHQHVYRANKQTADTIKVTQY